MRFGLIFLAAGLALLVVSELAGIAAIRILAFTLLAGGSAGVGVAFGLRPRPVGMLERIAAIFSRAAVCVVASVLVAPLLIVLTASLAGVAIQLLDPQSDANVPLIVAGGVTGLLLLAVTVTAFVTGIAAIRGKTRGKSAQEQA